MQLSQSRYGVWWGAGVKLWKWKEIITNVMEKPKKKICKKVICGIPHFRKLSTEQRRWPSNLTQFFFFGVNDMSILHSFRWWVQECRYNNWDIKLLHCLQQWKHEKQKFKKENKQRNRWTNKQTLLFKGRFKTRRKTTKAKVKINNKDHYWQWWDCSF